MKCSACNNDSNFDVWIKSNINLSSINGTELPNELIEKINVARVNKSEINTILCNGCGALLYIGDRSKDKWTGDLSWRQKSKVYIPRKIYKPKSVVSINNAINTMSKETLKELLTKALKDMEA